MGGKQIWPTRTESERERQAFRRAQNDDNFEKANKVKDGAEGNILILDQDGDIADSGKSFNDVVQRDPNIVYAESNYQILEDDEIIFIICSLLDITVTLPIISANKTYKIVKADETSFKGIIACQPDELINKNITLELYMFGESYEPTKVNRAITGSDWLI